MQETRVWPLGWKDPLEKEMATHSNTLAWEIPWTEEPGGLQSQGCKSQTLLRGWSTTTKEERDSIGVPGNSCFTHESLKSYILTKCHTLTQCILAYFWLGFWKKEKNPKTCSPREHLWFKKMKIFSRDFAKNPTESKVCQPEFTKEFRWPTLYNAWKSHLASVLQPGEIKDLYFLFQEKKKWHGISLDVLRQLEVLRVDARMVLLSTLVFCKSGNRGGRQS